MPTADRTGTLRYIDIAAVAEEHGGVRSDLVKELDWADAPSRARRAVRQGDILLSTVRPYLRGFGRVTEEFDNGVASTGFAVVRAKEGEAMPGFLWAVVNGDAFMAHLVSRQTGSSYPAVRPGDVEDFEFLVPGLDEQQRIADLVEAAEACSAALRAQMAYTADLRSALFNSLSSGTHVMPTDYDDLFGDNGTDD